MRTFKLLKTQNLLSSSLNNSNAFNSVDNETDKEDATARGLAIISLAKNSKTFEKNVFEEAVKNVKDYNKLKKSKSKPKRPSYICNKSEKSLSNSVSDIVIPKKVSKSNIQAMEINETEFCSSNIENLVPDNKLKTNINKTNKLSLSNNVSLENVFKTPKSIVRNFKPLESSMCTSSPIIHARCNEHYSSDNVVIKESENRVDIVDISSTISSLQNNIISPILAGRKAASLKSSASNGDIPEKKDDEIEDLDNSDDRIVKTRRKSSLRCVSNTSIENKLSAVTQPNLRENKSKRKSSSPSINVNVSIPKKVVSEQISSKVDLDDNKHEIISSGVRPKSSKGKRTLKASDNKFKTPLPVNKRTKSLEATMVTSSPFIEVRGKKKTKKISLDNLLISPITRGTKSFDDIRISQPPSVTKNYPIRRSCSVFDATVKPVITRYGRVVRSFAESARGRFISKYYLSKSQ